MRPGTVIDPTDIDGVVHMAEIVDVRVCHLEGSDEGVRVIPLMLGHVVFLSGGRLWRLLLATAGPVCHKMRP